MPTLIAPLGFTPSKLLLGVETARDEHGFDRVVVLSGPVARRNLSGDYDKHLAALDRTRSKLDEAGLEVEVHELSDAFDFLTWVGDLKSLVYRCRRDASDDVEVPVAFDVSAGPGALSAAVSFTASVEGVPVHYANPDSAEDVWLPVVDVPYAELLSDPKVDLLRCLADGARSASEIAEAVDRAPSTVSHHTADLEDLGLIRRVASSDGRKRRWDLTVRGRVLV